MSERKRVGLMARDIRCLCGACLKDVDDFEFGNPGGLVGFVVEKVMATCVKGHMVGIEMSPGRLTVEVLR